MPALVLPSRCEVELSRQNAASTVSTHGDDQFQCGVRSPFATSSFEVRRLVSEANRHRHKLGWITSPVPGQKSSRVFASLDQLCDADTRQGRHATTLTTAHSRERSPSTKKKQAIDGRIECMDEVFDLEK